MEQNRRLIDANALNMYFSDVQLANRGWKEEYCDFLDDVMEAVNESPTIEAEPVRHGRLGISYIDEYYGEFADCQYCGTDNILPCNFCRNCGAKMDLEVLRET